MSGRYIVVSMSSLPQSESGIDRVREAACAMLEASPRDLTLAETVSAALAVFTAVAIKAGLPLDTMLEAVRLDWQTNQHAHRPSGAV